MEEPSEDREVAAAGAVGTDQQPAKRARSSKRKRTKKKPVIQFGKLADPAPEGLPREAVESFLSQVELQLKLARTLVEFYPNPGDAVVVHRLLHSRIIELAKLADLCIADWTSFEDDQQSTWKQQTLLDDVSFDSKPKREGKQTCRWNEQENAMFNRALELVDIFKRGATKLIKNYVPTKSSTQIRDRLRRVRKARWKQEEDAIRGIDPAPSTNDPRGKDEDDDDDDDNSSGDDDEDDDEGGGSSSGSEDDDDDDDDDGGDDDGGGLGQSAPKVAAASSSSAALNEDSSSTNPPA